MMRLTANQDVILPAINHVEMQRIIEWAAEQLAKRPATDPLEGCRFAFDFRRNQIGNSIVVTDLKTGEKLDATDIDAW